MKSRAQHAPREDSTPFTYNSRLMLHRKSKRYSSGQKSCAFSNNNPLRPYHGTTLGVVNSAM